LVHVVAVLGDHPAGLTQLLWYLASREGLRVDSVDLWMHPDHLVGVRGLFQYAGHCFAKLEAALGGRAELLPRWQLEPRVDPPENGPVEPGYAVFAPSPPEFRRRLGARLGALPPEGVLIGGIAGASHTHFAHLLQAFESWAPESARILAVTIDPRIEVDVDVRTFVCPEGPIAFVPPEQQVAVEPVDWFAHAALVSREPQRRADSVLALARARLDRVMAGENPSTVTFEERGRFVHLRLGAGDVRLGREAWALFQALLAAAPQPVRPAALLTCGPVSGRRAADQVRKPASVTRLLRNVRAQIEAVAAVDPRWQKLVPKRLLRGWWALPRAVPDSVVPVATVGSSNRSGARS
jgi:hypothetical protein